MSSLSEIEIAGNHSFQISFLKRVFRYWTKMNLLPKFYCFFGCMLTLSFIIFVLVSSHVSYQGTIRFWGMATLAAVSLPLVLTWFFTRRIIHTLQSLNDAADRLSVGNFDVYLDMGPVLHCWEIMDCSRLECPAFGNRTDKCWYVDHTLCTGTVQERFPDKISDCRKCKVYENYRGDELANLSDSFNNAIHRIRHSVHERQQIHKQMLQHERLSTIGETVAGIAHSIKNILGMIKGGEYLIESGLNQKLPNRIREGWGMVKNGNRYISDLVLKMLTLCREHDPQYEEVELSEVVDSVLAVMQSKSQSKNVRFKTSLDGSLIRVIVDATCIREALINLTDNAIDACGENGGEITIGSNKGRNGLFDLYVEDNGSGIPQKHRTQILSPFFTTKGDKGTGLGLAVTEKIVSEHGGEISIHSQPGKGSRIVLRLPLLDRIPVQSVSPDVSNSISSKTTSHQSDVPILDKSMRA